MPVPTYDRFFEPICDTSQRTQTGRLARDVHDAAADTLGLTDATGPN